MFYIVKRSILFNVFSYVALEYYIQAYFSKLHALVSGFEGLLLSIEICLTSKTNALQIAIVKKAASKPANSGGIGVPTFNPAVVWDGLYGFFPRTERDSGNLTVRDRKGLQE